MKNTVSYRIFSLLMSATGVLCMMFLVSPTVALAKRTISGKITMPDGTPAKNVAVIAWDSDGFLGGKDDMMCWTKTDSNGNYRMSYYKSSPWDTKVPGSTSFRPDIYLTIHSLDVGVPPVKKTEVRSNWRMSNDLRIDVMLPGIRGKIYGAPASGLVVRAFDSDGIFAGKDDPIAQTKTNPDGSYMMLYGGKHYDSTPPSPGTVVGFFGGPVSGLVGIDALAKYIVDTGWQGEMHKRWTSWRPDIYVKVYANPAKKSRVFQDWPHRNTLTINFTLSSGSSSGTATQSSGPPIPSSGTTTQSSGTSTRPRIPTKPSSPTGTTTRRVMK